jgi:vitamin B12 transporter
MIAYKHSFSALLLLLSAASVKAQSTDKELDPVTITSNFSSSTLSRTGRNIQVIRGEQLLRLPVSSVDELLRYVPGVEVQARGPMGAQSDIVMRGGTYQQVLVIMDGIRLNDPFTGHFSAYFPVTPAEIERIEVLKGASAALYGSEAVGGVVHIITRTFAARSGIKSRALQAQVSGGSYRLLNGQAGGHYFDGQSGFSGGIISNDADGPAQRGTTGYFNVHTASFGMHHFINPSLRVAFRSSYDERNFAAQNFYSTLLSDTAAERVKTSWNQLSLNWERSRDRLVLDAGLRSAIDHYSFNSTIAANENQSGLWQVNARDEHRFSEALLLTGGIQFSSRSIESNDRGNRKEHQLAAIATANYIPVAGLTLVPALRIDWNQRRGLELVPQLTLSYRTGDWQFRSSIGKTIRDADFTERYNNYLKPLVASGSRIGNPDLEAERATAFEAGADRFLGKHLRLSGSFFKRWHRGLIDYVPTAYAQMPRQENLQASGTYALALNVARVTITGAELDLHYQQPLGSEARQLQGSAGITWAEAQSPGNSSGFYLTSFAKYLLNANLAYSSPRLVVGFTGIYKERAAAPSAPAIHAELSKDYFVLNGKVNFFILPRRLGLFVQADNLFDRAYSDLLGAQMPGRWWQAGAQLKL